MGNFRDLTNSKFGRLTVLERTEDYIRPNGRRKPKWLCVCECGNICKVTTSNLTAGSVKSCGCYQKEFASKNNRTHGKRKTSIYNIYTTIKQRCCNPNCSQYPFYGGKGLELCDRWKESFENFLEDMGERPSKEYSIDRIDNSLGYSKENCRWATRSMQGFNQKRHSSNTSGRTGVYWNKANQKWHSTIQCNGKIHLGYFESFEDAVKAREAAELKYYGFIKE